MPCRVPVTVKHRIGIDKGESYEFVRDFVGTVSEAGCRVFLVHARNAWLKGLSPKENREVPAAALRNGAPAQARLPAPDHRRERRHHDQRAGGRASWSRSTAS